MNRISPSVFLILLLLSLIFTIKVDVIVEATSSIIRVPQDYPTIQMAIFVANPGDTIVVSPGIYYENVVINKAITLKGENKSTTFIDGNKTGIVVSIEAENVWISGFTIQNGGDYPYGYGIKIDHDKSTIYNNIIKTILSGYGIIASSNRNLIQNNTLLSNVISIWGNNNTIETNRIIGGHEIGSAISLHGSYSLRKKTTGNIVRGNTINDTKYAMLLDYTDYNTISNNTITNNIQGIEIGFISTNNLISGNIISNNKADGVHLFSSSKNTFLNNTITNNHGAGISMYGNVAGWGPADDNIINANNISKNFEGIRLRQSHGNTIYENTISHNQVGISLRDSSDSSIYNNNFIDNAKQAEADEHVNYWDNDEEGNFWSDYVGWDNDSDGIGDIPYLINAYNGDNYPLMKPWSPPGERYWAGSYIQTYYIESGPWPKKVAEIHISAWDAEASGTSNYVLIVEILATGGEKVSGYLPLGGSVFKSVFEKIAEAVAANPDGSFDFTALELAWDIGWFYAGSRSKGTIKPFPLSWYPIPIPLFKLSTPGFFRLYFESSKPEGSTELSVERNTVVSLHDHSGRLYLHLYDSNGRHVGVDYTTNQSVTEIKGAFYAEWGSNTTILLPLNITEFHYVVDGTFAHYPEETYSLAIMETKSGLISFIKIINSTIKRGEKHENDVQMLSEISKVNLMPKIIEASIPNKILIGDPLIVEVNATDYEGIKSVSFKIWDPDAQLHNYTAELGNGIYTIEIDTSEFKVGTYQAYIEVEDTDGAKIKSTTYSLTAFRPPYQPDFTLWLYVATVIIVLTALVSTTTILRHKRRKPIEKEPAISPGL